MSKAKARGSPMQHLRPLQVVGIKMPDELESKETKRGNITVKHKPVPEGETKRATS